MHYVAIAKLPLFWISGRETCSLAASVGAGGGWLLSSSGIAEMERGKATLSDQNEEVQPRIIPGSLSSGRSSMDCAGNTSQREKRVGLV